MDKVDEKNKYGTILEPVVCGQCVLQRLREGEEPLDEDDSLNRVTSRDPHNSVWMSDGRKGEKNEVTNELIDACHSNFRVILC